MADTRWLLVGAGDISRKRVGPAIVEAAGSELAAVCDANLDAARHLASQHNCGSVYSDFEEALGSSDADAVYLATPVWLHAAHAVAALEAGKNVLVEKPLGLTAAECRTVVDAAKASRKTAGCAYFRRCSPRYKHARQMLDAGEFGRVVSVRMTYFSWFNPSEDDPKHWRVVRAKSGGGPISDMGSHMFDVLIGLFGMPVSVYAKCANLVHNWDVEDSARIILTLANGAHVTASFNWNSKTWRHEFEIVGTEAKLNWLPYDSGPVVKTVGRDIGSVDFENVENVHLPLVQDFVGAVSECRQPVCSIEEAFKTNILIDSVYSSASVNHEVELAL